MITWIAGLSGSGKSTVGRALVDRLDQIGVQAVLLDGDELRGALDLNDYSEAGRLNAGMKYAKLGELLAAQGWNVIISAGGLSPGLHPWARGQIHGYYAILLDVPLSEVRTRDTKTLYRRAASGEVRDLAGVDTRVASPEEYDGVIAWNAGDSIASTAAQAFALWQRFSGESR